MLSQQLRESIFVAAPIGAWHVARCYIWRAVLPTVLTAPSICPGRKSVPPLRWMEMAGLLGTISGARASRRPRSSSVTAPGRLIDSAAFRTPIHAAISPLGCPYGGSKACAGAPLFLQRGSVGRPRAVAPSLREKSAAPRGRPATQRPKIIFGASRNPRAAAPARGPPRFSDHVHDRRAPRRTF